MNTKPIVDLPLKPNTVKLVEENIGEPRCELGLGKNF